MRTRPLLIMLVVLVLGSRLIEPSRVAACGCDWPMSAEDAKLYAMLVFVGKVKAIEPIKHPYSWASKVWFQVDQVWKGQIGPTIMLELSQDFCDFQFDQGQAYLVYVDGRGHVYSCGSTRQFPSETALDAIAVYGPGEPPDPSIQPSELPDQTNGPGAWLPWLGLSVLIALLALGVPLQQRRQKRS